MEVATDQYNKTTEVNFRTSIGRSYYSSFLEARERVQNKIRRKIRVRGAEIHSAVIDELKSMNLNNIADKLIELKRFRTKSDYRIEETITKQDACNAITLATDIYSLLVRELP
ncbi:MAG: hypothetical protein WBF38_08315 [Nitrosotalea sp.]